jgi:broad specificity phosphatase PhoE
VRAISGDVLVFSSGHFLRVLATRWIGIEPIHGQSLMLGTASLSAVGYENSILRPAIRLWNDTNHVLTGQNAPRVHASVTGLQVTR